MDKKRMGAKFCNALLQIALLFVPVVVGGCRMKYYQPKEPEGLAEFADAVRKEARRA